MRTANQRVITYDKYDYNNFPLDVILSLSPIEGYLFTYLFNFKKCGTNVLTLSSKHFMESSGIARTAYTAAFNGLVKKGFLVDCEHGNYLFCPAGFDISDEEWLNVVKDYIYNKYSKTKYHSLDVPDEPELDIYPEYEDIKEDLASSGITNMNDFLDLMKGDD